MKSKDVIKQELNSKIQAALQSKDQDALASVMVEFAENLQSDILADAKAYKAAGDATILAQRGYRVLTAEENEYFSAVIEAMKSNDVKSAIAGIEKTLPTTEIEAITEDIKQEFPLLDAIDFINTNAVGKIFINAAAQAGATWGKLTSAVSKELEGAVQVLDITHNKLSAYAVVSQDMLLEGPVWVEKYIRAICAEAIGIGLENGIITGNGLDQPIGMDRDLSGSINQTTGYPQKTKKAITKLDPKTVGEICAQISKTGTGRSRAIPELLLIVGPDTYFTKIMPATTFLTATGLYARDVFPYNTRVIQSVAVPSGEAIFGLGKAYKLGAGVGKDGGRLEYSDEHQFIEDNRVYKIKMYANGRAVDNNAFVRADVSKLEPAAWPVYDTAKTGE